MQNWASENVTYESENKFGWKYEEICSALNASVMARFAV